MEDLNCPSELVYHIWPKVFCDSNGDGHGDLRGITQKLDHIKYLGFDAIWISPFFLSPEGPAGDGGYAVTDYRKIDPSFSSMREDEGTKEQRMERAMEDFEKLVARAHKLGLRVYTDFVLCHTSSDHEWFKKSCNPLKAGNEEYADYYAWYDRDHYEVNGSKYPVLTDGQKITLKGEETIIGGKPVELVKCTNNGQPVKVHRAPNNWKSVFKGLKGMSAYADHEELGNPPAWTYNGDRGQFYLHHFASSQPALNLNKKHVRQAVMEEMQFWLDKGVDGFRLDALPFANHDPKFRDNPKKGVWKGDDWHKHWAGQDFIYSMCQAQTQNELIPELQQMLKDYVAKGTPKILFDGNTSMGMPNAMLLDEHKARQTPSEMPLNGHAVQRPIPKTLAEVIAGPWGGEGAMEVAKEYLNAGIDSCYSTSLIQFGAYPNAQSLKKMLLDSLKCSPDGRLCNNASNHDFPRAASRMTKVLVERDRKTQEEYIPQELRSNMIRQLMALNFALPGSFCMYQGEELGLPQARIPEDIPYHLIKDEVGNPCRDGTRTPIPWYASDRDPKFWNTFEKNAGFSTSGKPYLPVAASHFPLAVNLQKGDPGSMLEFTRNLVRERKENPALSRGKTIVLNTAEQGEPDIFAFLRKTKDQTVLYAFNMSGHAKTFTPKNYLDEKTLNALDIPKWSPASRIHAYQFERWGLHRNLAVVPEIPSQQSPNGQNGPHARQVSKAKTLFALDLLVADHFVPDKEAQSLIKEFDLKEGEKSTTEDYPAIHQRLCNLPGKMTLGGSTSITLRTLKKLFKNGAHRDDVSIHFMGLAGNDENGNLIRKELKDTGIDLLTKRWPKGWPADAQKTAVSHVMRFPSGDYTLVTDPGTEKDGLIKLLDQSNNKHLLEESIKNSDIVYLPGSLMGKFGRTMTDNILKWRWGDEPKDKKELVLALPDHAHFGPSDNEYFKELISSADAVIGSDIGFYRLYKNPYDTEGPASEEPLKRITDNIQRAFRNNVLANNDRATSKKQVAFITRGDKPALLVTADKVQEIPAEQNMERINTLGERDTASAGFLYGYIKGYDHKRSAQIAMKLAAAKVSQADIAPYLDNPRQSLDRDNIPGNEDIPWAQTVSRNGGASAGLPSHH